MLYSGIVALMVAGISIDSPGLIAHWKPYAHRHAPVRRVPVYSEPVPTVPAATRRICSSIESFITVYEAPAFNSIQVGRLRLGTLVDPVESTVRDRIDWTRIYYPGGVGWLPASKLCSL